MFKKTYTLMAVLVVAAMLLAACAPQAATTEAPPPTEAPVVTAPPTEAPVVTEAPTETPVMTEVPTEAPTEAPVAFKACQVTDTGGIDDKSFNATAWKGVQDAIDQLGVEGKYLESQQQTDYEKNINAFIEEGCDIIITVGFLLGDATQAAAEANPDQEFSIVDFAYDPVLPNVLGQVFNTQEAAFLAGYAAAAVSKTGKVGTFGGIQIPPVTVFMDGYALGVDYYNQQKGTSVQVLGWDPAAQTGLFTGNFESTDDGRSMGQSLMDEGADIIMPVAGPVGLGTAAAAQERGGVYIIGVDTDWYVTAPEYAPILLTSVLKNMDVTTFDAIQAAMEGTFQGGVTVGTLENGGVGLAEFHDLASMVTPELQAELDAVAEGIKSGEIQASP
jgi:basic membrane protein A